jgi:hypothetical protein
MPSEPSPIDVTEGAGSCAGLVGYHGLQERRRGYEQEIAGDGAAEVQRPANKHVFKHLLEGSGRAAVAERIEWISPTPRSLSSVKSRVTQPRE